MMNQITAAAVTAALLLVALILPSVTAETASIIRHSHVFHLSPSSIVTSTLSDVSTNIASQAPDAADQGQSSLIEIDASSSRLDDESILSLTDKVLLRLDEPSAANKVRLRLSMNKLTPGGAAKLFERLVQVDNNKHHEGSRSNETSDNTVAEVEAEENVRNASDSNRTVSTSDEASDNTRSSQNAQDGAESEPLQNTDLEEVDLSFNDIGGHGSHSANLELLTSTRRLFEQGLSNSLVPKVLILENCGIGPAFCRSIGRGILNAFETQKQSTHEFRPSILHLGGNEAIGDPGAVSLSAALRLAASTVGDESEDDNQRHVINELDLSSCNIGDVGAESLALALAFNPNCISRLDLSNNIISDVGATAIGRALVEAHRRKFLSEDKSCVLEELTLDNNVKIGDDGAEALAEAVTCGAVRCISLRSCSIKAGGAAAFGNAVLSSARRGGSVMIEIDLSGNTLGIKPMKKKKGFKDKATSHISSLGKTLQKGWRGGLKGAGVSLGLTAESDDDEEVMGGLIEADDEETEQLIAAAARCGARAFVTEVLRKADGDASIKREETNIRVAFRRCNLDDGAVNAIAAAVTELKDSTGANLEIDVSMNDVEPDAVSALMGDEDPKKLNMLKSMAQQHMEALAVLNEAQERMAMAAEAAMARTDTQFGGLMFDEEESGYEEYDNDY